MTYRLITTPEHIASYELSMIEADITNLSADTLRALASANMSSQSLLNALNTGQYLVVCDQPNVPLFIKNTDRDFGAPDWLLNPAAASTQITSHLSHIAYATEVKQGAIASAKTESYAPGVLMLPDSPLATMTVSERIAKQRLERYKALDEANNQYIKVRFFYRANQGEQMQYGNWTGQRQPVAEVAWRLFQEENEIASGVTGEQGEVYVDTLLSKTPCVLEYRLAQAAPKKTTVKVNAFTHVQLPSFVLTHVYDDLENTPVPETPFTITLSNNTIIGGKTDFKGQVIMGPLEANVTQIEFYPEDSEEEIDASLKTLNQQLEDQVALYAEALAEEVVSEYAPSHIEAAADLTAEDQTQEQAEVKQLRADFEKAVADKINELKQQAAEFDGQTWYQKTWDIALAAGQGGMNGVTEYLPDLGSFGELLDKMQLDVPPHVVIKALATGDVDELERAFQQWQARAGEDYAEASAQMEMVLMLLKDSYVRETLLSLPQRFLEAAPTDTLVAMTASQATQAGIDVTAVSGATAFGAALGGVAAPITGGVAISATLGRKSAKIAEQISDTILSLSEALVKKRNKRTDSINGHSKHSQTPNQGKEKHHEPKHCQWQDCKTKHDKPIKYVNNGRTTRRLGFNKQWENEQLQPWLSQGTGQALPTPFHDPKHDAWELGFKGFISPLSRQRMKQSASNPSAGSPYPVQGHHLIPISIFSQTPKLKRNIELIGWDVNGKENGLFLPVFAPDILRHDLQMHRGPHPKRYKESIEFELTEIESECLNHCKNGNQKQLTKRLNKLSKRITSKIQAWDPDYLLREDSLQIKQALNKILKEETP